LSPNATPGWQDFVESMVPVRELTIGDRPRDWGGGTALSGVPDPDLSPPPQLVEHAPARRASGQTAAASAVPAASAPLTGPQRYVVQFTTTEEYVKLVERARALLSNALPSAALEELHLRAMQALVAELEKRKYAVTTPARERTSLPAAKSAPTSEQAPAFEQLPAAEQLGLPAQRGRYVSAATRRAVFERERGRCSYVDELGQACRETHCLEIHHLRAFGRGGGHALSNLSLRCRAHNTLAAEEEFGRALIERRRGSPKHEPSAVQGR